MNSKVDAPSFFYDAILSLACCTTSDAKEVAEVIRSSKVTSCGVVYFAWVPLRRPEQVLSFAKFSAEDLVNDIFITGRQVFLVEFIPLFLDKFLDKVLAKEGFDWMVIYRSTNVSVSILTQYYRSKIAQKKHALATHELTII